MNQLIKITGIHGELAFINPDAITALRQLDSRTFHLQMADGQRSEIKWGQNKDFITQAIGKDSVKKLELENG